MAHPRIAYEVLKSENNIAAPSGVSTNYTTFYTCAAIIPAGSVVRIYVIGAPDNVLLSDDKGNVYYQSQSSGLIEVETWGFIHTQLEIGDKIYIEIGYYPNNYHTTDITSPPYDAAIPPEYYNSIGYLLLLIKPLYSNQNLSLQQRTAWFPGWFTDVEYHPVFFPSTYPDPNGYYLATHSLVAPWPADNPKFEPVSHIGNDEYEIVQFSFYGMIKSYNPLTHTSNPVTYPDPPNTAVTNPPRDLVESENFIDLGVIYGRNVFLSGPLLEITNRYKRIFIKIAENFEDIEIRPPNSTATGYYVGVSWQSYFSPNILERLSFRRAHLLEKMRQVESLPEKVSDVLETPPLYNGTFKRLQVDLQLNICNDLDPDVHDEENLITENKKYYFGQSLAEKNNGVLICVYVEYTARHGDSALDSDYLRSWNAADVNLGTSSIKYAFSYDGGRTWSVSSIPGVFADYCIFAVGQQLNAQPIAIIAYYRITDQTWYYIVGEFDLGEDSLTWSTEDTLVGSSAGVGADIQQRVDGAWEFLHQTIAGDLEIYRCYNASVAGNWTWE